MLLFFQSRFFFKLAKFNVYDILEEIIFECIVLKKDVIERDEKDLAGRMKLNFGHTVGHAIERYNNYNGITHGQAVSIGMVYVTQQGEKLGFTKKNETEKLKKILTNFNLPISTNISSEDIFVNSLNDKKRRGNKITLALISEIGKSDFLTLSLNEYKKFLNC